MEVRRKERNMFRYRRGRGGGEDKFADTAEPVNKNEKIKTYEIHR